MKVKVKNDILNKYRNKYKYESKEIYEDIS